MNIVAVIFARGGSKGVKNKNIKEINKKPLISYTIQCALRSKYIKEIYVSTDSEKISKVAEKYGAIIPFLRPKELASDKSPEHLSWKHFVKFMKEKKKKKNFIFVALPCVTPLRTEKNIDDAIELYLNKKTDVVYTCMECFRNPYFNMVIKENDNIKPFIGDVKYHRRQDAPDVFDLTPSVIITNSKYIEENNNLFSGKTTPLIVSREEGVDIDDMHDFKIADLLITKKSLDYIICGLGSIGYRHFENICNLSKYKIGVLRRNKKKIKDYNNIPIFTELKECFKKNPKALIITTPSSLHIDIAIKAVKNNINVFIEKPLSNNLEKVKEFVNLVKEKEVTCMIGFDLRFHPGIIKMKEIIESGILGKIYSIDAQVGQYLPDWKPNKDYTKEMSAKKNLGGGVLLDLIHEIDYVTYLIGDVEYVMGIENKISNLNIETEDICKMILQFKSGTVGHIHLDYLQRKYSRTCKIVCENFTLNFDYDKDELFLINNKENKKIDYTVIDRNTRFLNEIKYFINNIENNEKCNPNELIGYNTLKIIDSVKLSYIKKKFIKINN